jgi:hypothetical protein
MLLSVAEVLTGYFIPFHLLPAFFLCFLFSFSALVLENDSYSVNFVADHILEVLTLPTLTAQAM